MRLSNYGIASKALGVARRLLSDKRAIDGVFEHFEARPMLLHAFEILSDVEAPKKNELVFVQRRV